ncbi:amidase [Novosphingobium sp. AP12]|uniref:amidase n=1 Tax=Novosphingobium sp. AP12 TaxID=1144305 RepID=UPI00027219FF|nr:amidase [Novosphingobium sp. AP12]EJL27977.1 amidase, Asp-tRNAAsn/Glu-tRNAGln amidotransferase A subunit [Novosphingobium sp. AP12]
MRTHVTPGLAALALACAWSGGTPAAARSPAPPLTGAGDSEVSAIHRRVADLSGSCVGLIDTYLDRIERLDGNLHAIVAVNPAAQVEAARIDRLSRRERRRLALPCVPVLVKDNIDVAGMATTAGSLALAGNVATGDAAAVTLLRRAGAIVLAKTNMSEFAFNYRGRSSIRGQTVSPFSFAESAGGSSSGNAAALAAGLGVVALGTDTSGSVRVPAALTGTVGLRPTLGAVPMAGVVPLSPSQDVIGPMCRYLADCGKVMAVLAPISRKDTSARPLQGLRVGVLAGLMRPHGEAEAQAIDALRRAGAIVSMTRLRDEPVLVGKAPLEGEQALFASRSAFDFPSVMDAYLPTRTGVPRDAAALLESLRTANVDRAVIDDVANFIVNRAGAASDPRFRVNGPYRDRYVAERIDEAFACDSGRSCFDVLVYPSVQAVAATADAGPDTAGTHRLAAYSGRPAIAFPVGAAMTEGGLRPVSLEMIGRPGDELRLVALAEAWQEGLALPLLLACESDSALRCVTVPNRRAARR